MKMEMTHNEFQDKTGRVWEAVWCSAVVDCGPKLAKGLADLAQAAAEKEFAFLKMATDFKKPAGTATPSRK